MNFCGIPLLQEEHVCLSLRMAEKQTDKHADDWKIIKNPEVNINICDYLSKVNRKNIIKCITYMDILL